MLPFLVVLACAPSEPPSCKPEAAWIDDDGDGYGTPLGRTDACPGTAGYADNGDDCDDGQAAVHPGATETCDGIDGDCDGEPDATSLWFLDADGDGYGVGAGEEACAAPSGSVAEAGDCDDTDVSVHPGAVETCNTIDDDCDGTNDEGFDDEDGDGHLSTACADGDDCDDADPGIYAGAPELCGDGRDNDCQDGDLACGLSGDFSLNDADTKIYSGLPNVDMARQIQVGDIDGDGTLDVLVAAEWSNGGRGGAHIVRGPVSGTHEVTDAGYAVNASGSMSILGRSIGVGDVNDDGYSDIELGAQGSDEAFVQFGPITADLDLADSSVHFDGSKAPLLGHGSDLADLNGDDVDDVIVGAFLYSGFAPDAGAVFIVFGPLTAGDYAILDRSDVELYGTTDLLQAGRVIAAGEDMDGDGIGDALIQAWGYTGGAPDGGGAFVFHGPFPSDLDLEDGADATLVGDAPGEFAGTGLAQGDVDGDGLSDALVGAPFAGTPVGLYTRPDGEACVVSGPTTGIVNLADADAVIHGTNGSWLGIGLAAGDLDADGQPELLVGAPGIYLGTAATYLFYGVMPGTWDDTDAAASFFGEESTDEAGSALRIADLDANGLPDLLFGAPSEQTGGTSAGALYIEMSY